MLKELVALCLLCTCSLAQDSRSIFQYLQDEHYSKLVELILAAGLQDEFKNTNSFPITLFAPTNAAIEAVPKDVLTSMMSNVTTLKNILQGHVLDQIVLGVFIRDKLTKNSRAGNPLTFNVYTNGVETVNGARVGGDVILSNGAVHSIDRLLLPLDMSMAATVASSDHEFRDLFGFLVLSRLYDFLSSDGPFTLFAPTDAAFSKVDVISLIRNVTALKELLKHHVVSGVYWSAGMTDGMALNTLSGSQITVHVDSGISIDRSNVTLSDIGAENGVIHAIDSVLVLP